MRKYNGSASHLRRAATALSVGSLMVLMGGLGGCAHERRQPQTRVTPVVPEQPANALPARATPELTTPDLNSQVRNDAPLRYVVKPGDTLWDIAGYYLRDPWYWPQLWDDNPDIANPHRIYPGEVLVLTRNGAGQPQLQRGRSKRLSPRIREEPIGAIATIPLDAIRAFITGPRLVSGEEIDAAPYVVSFLDQHLVGGKGNTVYLRGVDNRGDAPEDYSLVRDSGPYTDPDTGEILGREAVPVGEVHIMSFDDDVATGQITRSYREALVGDRLLPLEKQDLVHDFYPHAPGTSIEGRIISVYDGVSTIGQYQVVTLSVGSNDGIERGHILDIFEAGRTVKDPVKGGQVQLPPLRTGELMVFKTDEKVSFALIMRASRAVHVKDVVRSPEA